MVKAYIYGIRSVNNPRIVYVGLTVDPKTRWARHTRTAEKGNTHALYEWMRNIGIDNVRFSILEECTEAAYTSYAERYWIDSLREAGFKLFNIMPGGSNLKQLNWTEDGRKRITGLGNPFAGKIHTEESRNKMRESHLARDVARREAGIAHHLAGKRQKPEHVEKRIAATIAGTSPEVRAENTRVIRDYWTPDKLAEHSKRMSGEGNYWYGKEFPEEMRKKMSESAKNRPPISEDTRKKLRLRNHTRWHANRGIVKADCEFC